jgi:hypothetical protein
MVMNSSLFVVIFEFARRLLGHSEFRQILPYSAEETESEWRFGRLWRPDESSSRSSVRRPVGRLELPISKRPDG